MMLRSLIALLAMATLVTGCATKNWVRGTVTPVQAKVDQVEAQANRQGTELSQTRQDVEKNTTAIAATDEKATAADRRAGDAMNRAGVADQKATQNSQQIAALRQSITNLENYKVVQQTTVLFPFDRATLQQEYKQELDQLVGRAGALRRYFIAIEGYTDPTGDPAYNLELSKRRAEAVVQYLAGERDVDFNRIHTIGLGEQKLVDPATSRDARARNRRVEVKIYSADEALAAVAATGSN